PMLGHEVSLVSNAGRRQLTVRPSWGPAAHAAAGPNRRLPLASPGARNPRARSYGQACGAPGIFLGAAEVPLGERSEFLWAWVTAHSYWTRSTHEQSVERGRHGPPLRGQAARGCAGSFDGRGSGSASTPQ